MSDRDNGPIFVWLPGVGGRLEAQKWSGLYSDYKGRMDNVIASHPITERDLERTPIDYLALRFPAPRN